MPLKIEPRERWVEITLNRPPRNILDTPMLEALVTALDAQARGDAPMLLLRSEGKHFSTGYPIEDIPEEIFHSDPYVRAETPFEKVMDRLTHYPAPIVAARVRVRGRRRSKKKSPVCILPAKKGSRPGSARRVGRQTA